jgi:DNA-binding MarR family transcriptional regulator
VAAAATELGTAPNTVSTLVGALVDAGLVRREPDPHDRRFARLYLTPEAARQVTKWRDLRAARLREVLDRLPADDRERLADGVAVLTRVAAELREDEP